jgi:hypothetical protein
LTPQILANFFKASAAEKLGLANSLASDWLRKILASDWPETLCKFLLQEF